MKQHPGTCLLSLVYITYILYEIRTARLCQCQPRAENTLNAKRGFINGNFIPATLFVLHRFFIYLFCFSITFQFQHFSHITFSYQKNANFPSIEQKINNKGRSTSLLKYSTENHIVRVITLMKNSPWHTVFYSCNILFILY